MTIDAVFWTQIGSILGFIGALFILYRLLAEQKDATIQLLKESVSTLKDQLAEARRVTPDILAQTLSSRVKLLETELEQLAKTHGSTKEAVELKEKELQTARRDMEKLSDQIQYARDLLEDFSCPFCGRPLTVRTSYSEPATHKGYEFDIDHEYVEYECGHALRDGKVEQVCPVTAPFPSQ